MKKFTNYAPGPRGITLKSGETVWLQPGQSESVDPKDIVDPLPDFGSPAAEQDTSELEAITAERDELKVQVAEQAKELEGLRADLEKATKPAK